MKKLLPDIKKIAIFRALQLGDLLCAVPVFRALRKAYPEAEIVLLGLPWASSFVQRFQMYIDRFIHFPGYEGLPEQPFDAASFRDFTQCMKQEAFDLIIQMQGNGTIVNKMLQDFDAANLAGFDNNESEMHSKLFLPYPNHGPEPMRHIWLMQHLGIKPDGDEMEFPITEKDRQDFEKLALPIQQKKYVCIHPGSRGSWRQWPPKYFALLADYCIENGYTVVVTGTNEERDITRELIKCIRHPVIDCTGKTNLGAMAVLIKNAAMLIANCTGVSHMAAALKTPSFIISMDGEPERWSPINRALHHVIDWTQRPHLDRVFLEAVDFINNLQPRHTRKVA